MAPIQHEFNLPALCLEFYCINKFSQLKITFITTILQTILTFVYTLRSDTYQNGFMISIEPQNISG